MTENEKIKQMEGLRSAHKKYVFEQLVIEVRTYDPLSFKLKNELETFPLDARKDIANCLGKDGWSPLFIACIYGKRDKAEYLIRTCGADVEQKSYYGADDFEQEVTPLWAAAIGGHLSTVELLFQSGVDINKQNYKGKGETCLMNSVRNKTLCDFLLKNGADVNAKDIENKTALHYAIGENELETTKLLLEHGADHTTKSSQGDDALQMACLEGAVEIWEYLNSIISYSPERIAKAQELLGASLIEHVQYAEYDEEYAISESLNLWKQALIIRDEYGLHPKQPINMPLHESYRNQREFETLDELMAMGRDVDKIKMQSLLITERNLGIHHPIFIRRLECRGNPYAAVMDYQRSIDFRRRALQIKTEKDTILHSDTSTTAEALVNIMLDFSINSVRNNIGNTEQRFHDIVETFKVLTQNFEEIGSTLLIRPRYKKHLNVSETIFRCISHLVYLLIETAKTKNNKELVIKLLARVINFKNFLTGDSLLHYCTSKSPNYFLREGNIEEIFPNVNVVKQLLEYGANVHARNNRGWTPLHVAVMSRCTNLVKLLLDFGAHIDESDGCGSTLFDRIRAFDYDNADMFYFKYISLKCLCAKQILKNNIPYVGQLPKSLESFVKMHDCNRKF